MRKINSRSVHYVNDVAEYVVHIPGAAGDPAIHQTVMRIDDTENQIDELLDKLSILRNEQLTLKQNLYNYLFGKHSMKVIDDARSARAKFVNNAE